MRYAIITVLTMNLLGCAAANNNAPDLEPAHTSTADETWHCVEISPTLDGANLSPCFPTLRGCERARVNTKARKLFAGTCQQTSSVVCFTITDEDFMSKKRNCVSTAAECERARQVPIKKDLKVSECTPIP